MGNEKRPDQDRPLRQLDTPRRRRNALRDRGLLAPEDRAALAECPGAWNRVADGLIENAIGVFPVPLGVAENFVIDGRPTPVVMATEERTVVAAASKAAKLCLPSGFATTAAAQRRARAQILWTGVSDSHTLINCIRSLESSCRKALLKRHPELGRHGRTLLALRPYRPDGSRDDMMVVELEIDPGESMGAGTATRMAELVGDMLERLVGRRRTAAIVTNHGEATDAVQAAAVWPRTALPAHAALRISELNHWAACDQSRLATHLKGILNGVSAVALATGQDTRAVEAAVHSAAHRPYGIDQLTRYSVLPDGSLSGHISLPLPVGVRGGATAHPVAVACRDLMGTPDRSRLAAVMAAAGLAQNFAALLCLATDGITAARAKLAVR